MKHSRCNIIAPENRKEKAGFAENISTASRFHAHAHATVPYRFRLTQPIWLFYFFEGNACMHEYSWIFLAEVLMRALDLDDMSFKSVKYWALKANEESKLGGGAIFRSSYKHHHVVFDRYVSREENLRVVAWVAILSKSVPMLRYLAMQCIKPTGSTLRVAPNPNKKSLLPGSFAGLAVKTMVSRIF